MALTIKKIEKLCQTKFPCKVQDGGFDDHKHGYRTIKIIVGKKDNVAFEADTEKRKKLEKGHSGRKRFIPDVRIIYVPGSASRDWLMRHIKKIYKTLPENQTLPKFDESIASIEDEPEKMYAKPKKKIRPDEDFDDEDDWDDEDPKEDWDDTDDYDAEEVDDDEWGDDEEEDENEKEPELDEEDDDGIKKDGSEHAPLVEGLGKIGKVVSDVVETQKEMMGVLSGFNKRLDKLEKPKGQTKETNKAPNSKKGDE